MTYDFCTYFDHRYLPRALTLYHSLKIHCPSFRLWALSLSEECSRQLRDLRLPEVHTVNLADLTNGDEALLRARENRTLVEFYFTLTSSWLLYLFSNVPDSKMMTYLDADLFFFSDPAQIFQELGASSIGIIEHRFPENLQDLKQFGIYNVGWLSFRRNDDAIECLKWWRERCIEWCYDRVEEGRFADQKYLDDWPVRFKNVKVLQHKGAGLAPWNASAYSLSEHKNQFWVDGEPLIFFHYHSLTRLSKRFFRDGLTPYGLRPKSTLKKIYAHYLRQYQKYEHFTGLFQSAIRHDYGNASLLRRAMQERLLLVAGPLLLNVDLPPLLRPARYVKRLFAGRKSIEGEEVH